MDIVSDVAQYPFAALVSFPKIAFQSTGTISGRAIVFPQGHRRISMISDSEIMFQGCFAHFESP